MLVLNHATGVGQPLWRLNTSLVLRINVVKVSKTKYLNGRQQGRQRLEDVTQRLGRVHSTLARGTCRPNVELWIQSLNGLGILLRQVDQSVVLDHDVLQGKMRVVEGLDQRLQTRRLGRVQFFNTQSFLLLGVQVTFSLLLLLDQVCLR